MTERAMFARWSLVYKINFHYPSWKATIANVTANIDTPFLRKYKEALQNVKISDKKSSIVIKDGKKYRVIRKSVPKKVGPAARGEETQQKNPNKKINFIHRKKTIVKKTVKRRPKQIPKAR